MSVRIIKHKYKFKLKDISFILRYTIWPWIQGKKLYDTSKTVIVVDDERVVKGIIVD
jgi:hypothetical protein